jgi:tetratricopeptide (TPR) repeat protein
VNSLNPPLNTREVGMHLARLAAVALLLTLHPFPAAAQLASEHDRREAWRHYRNGQELMLAERFEQAAAEFQAAIDNDRLLTLAHYSLGQAYMELRRFASAAKAYNGCRGAFLTLHGLRERDRVNVERQRDEEIRELQDSIRRLLADPNARMNNLKVARVEARIHELERQRTSNTSGFVSPPELSLALGSAYFRNGQLDEAEREWKVAVAVNSRLAEAHNNLAALYAMTGRRTDAEMAVKSAEKSGFKVHPGLKTDIRKLPME